jgi:NMD protein affecting ribosome stability and mRNA decay
MGRGGQPNDVKRIRRNIENYGDPYITQAGRAEVRMCSVCEAVYYDQRWYLKNQVDTKKLRGQEIHYTVCPACRKTRDRSPGGIVHLSGDFILQHKDDIMNLIRNEGDRAMAINPLERIIDIEGNGAGYNVLTTNERLAQRVGKALHRAYGGDVTYKWSEDNKLARVVWRRD